VAFEAPFLVLLAPGQPHSFASGPGDDSVYSELTFAGTLSGAPLRSSWNDLLKQRFSGPCRVAVHGPAPDACVRAIDHIIADLTSLGHAEDPQAEGHARRAIDDILGLLWQHLVAMPSDPVDAVSRARNILDQRLEDPPSAAELSRLVGMPAKRLARIFTSRYGAPPGRYRQKVSMDRAADLLRGTSLSLSEVAERLGFHDQRYFIRVFKAVHGVTPARFRRA
jgi:AraC-like DNA-binding protein